MAPSTRSTRLPDLRWLLALAATACGGAQSSLSIEVTVDGDPAPLASSPCAEGKRYFRGKRRLRVSAEPAADLRRVALVLPPGEAAHANAAPFELEWNTASSADGDLALTIVATSVADRMVEQIYHLCVDNQPPSIDLPGVKEPLAVHVEDATLELAVDAFDRHGVRSIKASLAPSGAAPIKVTCAENLSSAVCRLSPAGAKALKPGEADLGAILAISAEDRAGNVAERKLKVELRTRLAWTFDAGGHVEFGVAALGDGRVAVATNRKDDPKVGHRAVVLSKEGAPLCEWEPRTVTDATGTHRDAVTSSVVVSKDDQRVLFTTARYLVALAPPTAGTGGTPCPEAWGKLPEAGRAYYYSRPAVTDEVVLVVDQGTGDQKARLDAFLLASGASAGWSLSLSQLVKGKPVYSSPAPTPDGAHVFIGDEEGRLQRAPFPAAAPGPATLLQANGPIRTAALALSDRVLIATPDAFVRALDPSGGSLALHKGASAFATDPALAPDGRWLYVGAKDGYLYSLDGKTLDLEARYAVERMAGQLEANDAGDTIKPYTSPVVGPGGIVYAACASPMVLDKPEQCRLNALSAGKLELLWSFRTASQNRNVFLGSPALGPNRLYIASTGGIVYAFDIK